MATVGHSEGTATLGPYRVFCSILLLIACAEWFVYHQQRAWGISTTVLLPGMMIMAGSKFLAAVAWLMGRVDQVSAMQRTCLFLLVINGSAIIAVLVLAESGAI